MPDEGLREHPWAHPLSQRCEAQSKRSGQQCKRWALIGATTCPIHGSSAKQVRAAAERRVLLWEASQKALPAVIEGQPEPSADEILVGILSDVRRTLEQLKVELAINASPVMLILLGDWLDRAERIARSTIITGAEQRIEQRKIAVAEQQAGMLATAIYIGVTSSNLSARQQVEVVESVLAAVKDRELPVLTPELTLRWLADTRRVAEQDEALANELAELSVIPA